MKWSKVFLSAMVLMFSMVKTGGATAEDKPWLVIEPPSVTQDEDKLDVKDFPRLLLMQVAKAGVFRCVDRATYKTQTQENALGDGGEIEFKAAGFSISWVIRSKVGARGTTLSVSLGYNNISRKGNGELTRSENVVVRERGLKGVDLLTAAAKKSARAIVFGLRPSEVLELEKASSGKQVATVSYGKDFFNVGDEVYFVRETVKKGHKLSKKVGLGKVTSTDSDTTIVTLQKGVVEEGNILELKINDEEAAKADLCPDCDGKKKMQVEVKCDDCNGQGKLWHIKGRSRTLKPCQVCKGRGTRQIDKICPTCEGSGRCK